MPAGLKVGLAEDQRAVYAPTICAVPVNQATAPQNGRSGSCSPVARRSYRLDGGLACGSPAKIAPCHSDRRLSKRLPNRDLDVADRFFPKLDFGQSNGGLRTCMELARRAQCAPRIWTSGTPISHTGSTSTGSLSACSKAFRNELSPIITFAHLLRAHLLTSPNVRRLWAQPSLSINLIPSRPARSALALIYLVTSITKVFAFLSGLAHHHFARARRTENRASYEAAWFSLLAANVSVAV
jgi:hypothetical protein